MYLLPQHHRDGQRVKISGVSESAYAYLPPLLPFEPELSLSYEHLQWLEKASRALGQLDGIMSVLQDVQLFMYMYVRKEAVLSSQIEGTQSSLSDILLFENHEMPGVPLDDVMEVLHYVRALERGQTELKTLPISSRLIRNLHQELLQGGRGADKLPGEFRRSQNWIGGTRPGNARYVPPPHEYVAEYMGNLENFLHNPNLKLSPLIKVALMHVQFESIHPFLDGNGRIGRLLIPLVLYDEGILSRPVLYLSLYFKTYREEYYRLLQEVRTKGAWEDWLLFFLEGVYITSQQAFDTVKSLLSLFQKDKKAIETLKRLSGSVLQVFDVFSQKPIQSMRSLQEQLNLANPTIYRSLEAMQELGVIQETTGKSKHRIWVYGAYVDLLNQGLEMSTAS